MTVVLVAHGTRDPRGVDLIGRLAEAVVRRDEEVAVSFVDVLGPSPSEVLTALPSGPVTLLPAFLARGYHVRVDIARHVRQCGRDDVRVAQALGPSRLLARALKDRLAQAGTMCNGAIVLAAAGSSDPQAHRDVADTARLLSHRVSAPITIGFASVSKSSPADSPYPSVVEAVAQARARSDGPVAVASYLLADGLFQSRLADSGADVVAQPLGLADPVIELACARIAAAADGAADPRRLMLRRGPVGIRA